MTDHDPAPQSPARHYRPPRPPRLPHPSRRNLATGKLPALIAHPNATSTFLHPEDLPALPNANFNDLPEDLRNSLP